ncbi:hypothetical protein [Archangium sp.]|uniref:hypothetical protein n=1 Tax=Archangium sp. TaxID=1872627 RepID=UPI00389AD48B
MHRLLKLTGALALVLSLTACQEEGPVDGEPYLSVSASTRTIDDLGQTTTLRVSATDAAGASGTGSVTLTAPAGILGNDSKTTTVTLEAGSATVNFKCPKAQDTGCAGPVVIDAAWNQVTAKTTITVGSGTTNGDGGTDGGTGSGTDAGTGDGGMNLAASKDPIFYNVGDSSLVTASLKRGNGTAWAGETIAFSTSLGGLTPQAGGSPTTTLSATTGSDGTAAVRFVETGSAGTATIQATHAPSNQSKVVQVNVTTVQQITHTSTLCNGAACTIMGVRGSGFNEQAQITFTLKDSSNRPAQGVTVTFSIPNAPKETTVTPTGVTNPQGQVTATISAGPTIGAFVVHATAIAGKVEVDSPNIGIRGAKSANDGFTLKCDLVNIAAHVSASPPASFDVNCKVKVVDRFNNPVGTGTTVNFKTEAGSITNSVVTTKYDPNNPTNSAEGEASLVFKTFGGRYPPVDVDPLGALPGQFPFARDMEPSAADGQLIRNPRDSLVTIIAYMRGEEFFSDTNSNGVRDPDEQFIDQGEPFVDSNDNGVWDEGEVYIDEAPADGKWNGPNGIWDKDTSIWTEAHILYTGRPVAANTKLMLDGYTWPPVQTDFSGGCGAGVARGTFVTLNAYFGDTYFNRPQVSGVGFSTGHTATKGGTQSMVSALQDGFGFGIERLKLNAADGSACQPSTKVCVWKTLFYKKWEYGYVGDFRVNGAPLSDTQACQPDTASFTTTVLGVGLTATTSGAIQ